MSNEIDNIQTPPTTAECIEWLMKIILADGWSSNPKYTAEYNAKINATIRAKLLAADEMAKALPWLLSDVKQNNQALGILWSQIFNDGEKALADYRAAGGK